MWWPTDFVGRMTRVVSGSFGVGRKRINRARLMQAIASKDAKAVSAELSAAVASCEKDLQPKIEKLISAIRDESGKLTAKDLVKQLQRRHSRALAPANGKTGFTFDTKNEDALAWAKEHAADLVTGVSDTTREEIKGLIEDMFDDKLSPDELYTGLVDAIGDEERAQLIAETETMAASNAGIQESWDQAVEEGLLTGSELQVWIVTPDETLCPICEGLDGETAPLDGQFESDGESYDGPPAHPRCRCTIGLQIGE